MGSDCSNSWPLLTCYFHHKFRCNSGLAHETNEPRHEKIGVLHICENKDADQLRGNREAYQRLCFRHTDSAIPRLSKSESSSI